VNVQSSNFGAQYGNGVASFNAILKSGAKPVPRLGIRIYPERRLQRQELLQHRQAAAPLRWNEYGGSVGGPIIRDKLFFYFTYQRNPNTASSGVVHHHGADPGAQAGLKPVVFPTSYVDQSRFKLQFTTQPRAAIPNNTHSHMLDLRSESR
jgi:hypothetical protein